MNKHLNFFNFFNNNDYQFYEDNLSRAFALCLKNDVVLLDNVLHRILKPEIYSSLFNNDNPDTNISIDIQKNISDLGTFSKIIAVACSGAEIDIDKIQKIKPSKTEKPITDLCIEINDTCIIFEFKRNEDDCSAQLKGQALRLKERIDDDVEIIFIDYNWKKIVQSMLGVLSLQRQINSENIFTADFISFLETNYPQWFPQRLLSSISFPQEEYDTNYYYLDSRLNQIKAQVANILNATTKVITGKYNRVIISVDWYWTNEIHINPYIWADDDYITIEMYAGDTKAQGWHFYKHDEAIVWPDTINEYQLEIEPYLKFSHFNSGLFWYEPSPEEYKITHRKDFFEENSGRWKKDEHWSNFERMMNNLNKDWKSECSFEQEIIQSNRSYFDLSIGIHFKMYISFKEAQLLDDNDLHSSLAKKISEAILELKSIIKKERNR